MVSVVEAVIRDLHAAHRELASIPTTFTPSVCNAFMSRRRGAKDFSDHNSCIPIVVCKVCTAYYCLGGLSRLHILPVVCRSSLRLVSHVCVPSSHVSFLGFARLYSPYPSIHTRYTLLGYKIGSPSFVSAESGLAPNRHLPGNNLVFATNTLLSDSRPSHRC